MKTLKLRNIAAALAAGALVAGCSQSESSVEGVDLSAQARAAAEASGYVPPNGGKDGGELIRLPGVDASGVFAYASADGSFVSVYRPDSDQTEFYRF